MQTLDPAVCQQGLPSGSQPVRQRCEQQILVGYDAGGYSSVPFYVLVNYVLHQGFDVLLPDELNQLQHTCMQRNSNNHIDNSISYHHNDDDDDDDNSAAFSS